LIKKKHYSGQSGYRGYSSFQNDSTGKPVRVDHYSSDNALTGYKVLEYDAAGNITGEKNYLSSNTLKSQIRFENVYDANNRLVQIKQYI
jgi:hypothetical protein